MDKRSDTIENYEGKAQDSFKQAKLRAGDSKAAHLVTQKPDTIQITKRSSKEPPKSGSTLQIGKAGVIEQMTPLISILYGTGTPASAMGRGFVRRLEDVSDVQTPQHATTHFPLPKDLPAK
jgi:hypothetical protein